MLFIPKYQKDIEREGKTVYGLRKYKFQVTYFLFKIFFSLFLIYIYMFPQMQHGQEEEKGIEKREKLKKNSLCYHWPNPKLSL